MNLLKRIYIYIILIICTLTCNSCFNSIGKNKANPYVGISFYQNPTSENVKEKVDSCIQNGRLFFDGYFRDYEKLKTFDVDSFFAESNAPGISQHKIEDPDRVYYGNTQWNTNPDYKEFYIIEKNKEKYVFYTTVNESVIQIDAGYKLFKYKELTTSLSETMPLDFSFKIKFGFDGYYNSSTNILENGYNHDLNESCKTILKLSKQQLNEIYLLLREAKIDKIPDYVYVNGTGWASDPSFSNVIECTVNGEVYKVEIDGVSDVSLDEWISYKLLGENFNKIFYI